MTKTAHRSARSRPPRSGEPDDRAQASRSGSSRRSHASDETEWGDLHHRRPWSWRRSRAHRVGDRFPT